MVKNGFNSSFAYFGLIWACFGGQIVARWLVPKLINAVGVSYLVSYVQA
jgi:Na+/glutamate symporter